MKKGKLICTSLIRLFIRCICFFLYLTTQTNYLFFNWILPFICNSTEYILDVKTLSVLSPENALYPGCPCLSAVSDRFRNSLNGVSLHNCMLWDYTNWVPNGTSYPNTLQFYAKIYWWTITLDLWNCVLNFLVSIMVIKEEGLLERMWGIELVFHRYSFRGIISPFPLIIKLILSTQNLEVVYILW